MRAFALNCSLKGAGAESSTDVLLGEVLTELRSHGVEHGEIVRVVDHDVKPGISSDEGEGDAWPALRRDVLDAEILVIGTPIWMGQPSSVCKRVLERLNAMIGEADDAGRMPSYGRVAIVAVVGNEDGAHHVSAEVFQSLDDSGFSLAANAVTYWVGEAMQRTDYKDVSPRPAKTQETTELAVRNAVHLARLLGASGYPPS